MLVTLQWQAELEPIVLVNSNDSFSYGYFSIRHFLRLKSNNTEIVFCQVFQHSSDSWVHLNFKFHMKTSGESYFNWQLMFRVSFEFLIEITLFQTLIDFYSISWVILWMSAAADWWGNFYNNFFKFWMLMWHGVSSSVLRPYPFSLLSQCCFF